MTLFEPNFLSLCKAISGLTRLVESQGFGQIRIDNNIESLRRAAEAVGKASVGEHFIDTFNTIPPDHIRWIKVHDAKGECAMIIAAKYEDISGFSLNQYIVNYFERTFKAKGGDQVSLHRSSASFANNIFGSTVYIGEGYVREDCRGGNLLGLVQRILILTAFNEWRPNIIYGFMRPDKIEKSYHLKWGYSIARPSGLIWQNPPKQKDLHDLYFVGLGAEGVCRLIAEPYEKQIRHSSNSKKEKLPQHQ